MDDITRAFYQQWSDSDEYEVQSALENDKYDKCMNEIKAVIGEKECRDISDSIVDLACEAECAGFIQGLRYGIMFINNMVKGQEVA